MNDDDVRAYGFLWGPMRVIRMFQYRGARILKISTDSHEGVEVRVSEKGHSIRVWDRKTGKELK